MRSLIALTILLSACGSEDQAPQGAPPAPPVEFVHPQERTVQGWDDFSGRLESVDAVEVRSRVSGYLQEIHFEDGQMVEAGQLLFQVDPAPFAAQLNSAKAEVQRAQAARDFALSNLNRGKKLVESNAIATEEVDLRTAALAEAEAALLGSQARVDAAQLNLDYTSVKAPISGRVSDHYISVGNLISGGSSESTLLTTIVGTDPIYVRIEAGEDLVLTYQRLNAAGKRKSAREHAVPVHISLADEAGFPHEGVLDFVDNRFDEGTATLRARAKVPNPDGLMVPGMFARLRLTSEAERQALVVPELALQTAQNMRYLLVLDEEDKVSQRPVQLGILTEDGMREILSGVTREDRVLVAGLFFARPGSKVTPMEKAQPAQEDAPQD